MSPAAARRAPQWKRACLKASLACALLLASVAVSPRPSHGDEVSYRFSFAAGTVAPDRLERPLGLAVDRQGNVVLADGGMARIQRRTAGGELLAQWSSFTTSKGAERLIAPRGVAVDTAGNIAVTDAQRKTVRVFSPQGLLLRSFGSEGTADGDFLRPVGIAVDGQNNLYVVDEEASRVQKFRADGAFVLKLGGLGGGQGQLRLPTGIAVDGDGSLYIADTGNNLLQKFDAQGRYLRQWGGLGTEDGRFQRPVGLAIDAEGNVLVADTGNRRVQKFSPQGEFLAKWDAAAEWLAVDASGAVLTSSPQGSRVDRYSTSGDLKGSWGRAGARDGELRAPRGVALDPQGNILVADSLNHRVQVFDPQGKFLRSWGTLGTQTGQFDTPVALTVDRQGLVYVVEAGNNRVQKFDSAGKFLATWGRSGSGEGEFQSPAAIATNGAVVLVLDTGNYRVQKFDTSGKFLASWGSQGSGNGQFLSPVAVAVDAAGNAYVADYAGGDRVSNALQRFGPDGALLQRWTSGDLPNVNPTGIVVDGLGNIYLADHPRPASLFPQAGRDRVVKLDPSGRLLAQVGGPGIENGQLAGPTALAVSADADIFVADTMNQRVQKFSFLRPTTPISVGTPTPAPPPVLSPVDAPFLLSPGAGAALTSVAVSLSWKNPPSVTQYHLQVVPHTGDGPGLDLIVGDTALVQAASYTIPAPALGRGPYLLLPDMTYYWRVRTATLGSPLGAGDEGWNSWSEIRTFRTPTRSALGVIPVAPHDGQMLAGPSTTLSWRYTSGDVFYFEVQMSTDPAFETDPEKARASVAWNVVHGGETSPGNSWNTPSLEKGIDYYWRVRPRVQGDGKPVPWSPAWRFRAP